MQNARGQSIESFFPFWEGISADHREDILSHAAERVFPKGSVMQSYGGEGDCMGLMLVRDGQLRAFLGEDGKAVTLYRLFSLDVCLFSSSCIMRNIQFDIQLEAEKETRVWLVPASLCDRLMQQSLAMADFINQLMASRFSDVVWTLDQLLFKSMDNRIASLLLELSVIEGTDVLSVTHEMLANQLGTAREVVTRLLKYFQDDGVIALSRGNVRLLDMEKLRTLA